jgi:hypothetical protein
MARAPGTASGMPRSVLAYVGSLAVAAVAALVVSIVWITGAPGPAWWHLAVCVGGDCR